MRVIFIADLYWPCTGHNAPPTHFLKTSKEHSPLGGTSAAFDKPGWGGDSRRNERELPTTFVRTREPGCPSLGAGQRRNERVPAQAHGPAEWEECPHQRRKIAGQTPPAPRHSAPRSRALQDL